MGLYDTKRTTGKGNVMQCSDEKLILKKQLNMTHNGRATHLT